MSELPQRKIAVILRGAVASDPEQSLLIGAPGWEDLAARGSVQQVLPDPDSLTPDLALLGVSPNAYAVSQGETTASALRLGPPDKSVLFHLNLCTLQSETVLAAPSKPRADETAELQHVFTRLETNRLFPRWGESLDHCLVWLDGSLDIGTTPLVDCEGKEIAEVLPVGEGDTMVRRLIDDSVNLLMETEANRRREGEGEPLLNLLWPWGQGMARRYPSLTLRRGENLHVESADMRLVGLARLFGCSHGNRSAFAKPLTPDIKALFEVTTKNWASVIVLDHLGEALKRGRFDEGRAMLDDVREHLVKEAVRTKDVRLTIAALSADSNKSGLVFTFDTRRSDASGLPFDERTFDDRRAGSIHLWEAVDRTLSP